MVQAECFFCINFARLLYKVKLFLTGRYPLLFLWIEPVPVAKFSLFYFYALKPVVIQLNNGTLEFFKSKVGFHFIDPGAGNDDLAWITGDQMIEFQEIRTAFIKDIELLSRVIAVIAPAFADILLKIISGLWRESFVGHPSTEMGTITAINRFNRKNRLPPAEAAFFD